MEKHEALKEQLAETRAELLEVARELDRQAWSHPVYAHDEQTVWSAGDLLRHLTWSEGGMLRLMRQVKDGGGGVPEGFDLDRYNARGVDKLKDKMPAELLVAMEENRQQLLEFIDRLAPEDWEKEGRHGSSQMMTIAQVVETIAAHEAQHLEDLRRALGQVGDEAVETRA